MHFFAVPAVRFRVRRGYVPEPRELSPADRHEPDDGVLNPHHREGGGLCYAA